MDGFHHKWLYIDSVRISLGGVASVTYQMKSTFNNYKFIHVLMFTKQISFTHHNDSSIHDLSMCMEFSKMLNLKCWIFNISLIILLFEFQDNLVVLNWGKVNKYTMFSVSLVFIAWHYNCFYFILLIFIISYQKILYSQLASLWLYPGCRS